MRSSKRQRRRMNGEVSVVIDGHTWGFVTGPDLTVIVSPDGRKTLVKHSVLTGLSDADRAKQKKTPAELVTPDHVRHYVRAHRGDMTGDPAVVGARGRGRGSP